MLLLESQVGGCRGETAPRAAVDQPQSSPVHRNGATPVVEDEETKIVPVRKYRGVLAYWGYAGDAGGRRIVDWLRERTAEAADSDSPERFAERLAQKLEAYLKGLGINREPRCGIGLHFSAYERVSNYWIPELFLISNFADVDYASLRPEGVGYSRETYATIAGVGRTLEDRSPDRRMRVHDFLQEDKWLRFNNGDPLMFNPTADGLAVMLLRAAERGALANLDLARLRHFTRLPVEVVARMQTRFYRDGNRVDRKSVV